MEVIQGGPPGINVVGHVVEELSTLFVTATIPSQRMVEEVAGDWAQP